MSKEVTNQEDYACVFEKIVKKVWGRPKTDVYFSNFYNGGNPEFKYILFSICVYLKEYEGYFCRQEKNDEVKEKKKENKIPLSNEDKIKLEEYTENFIENLENHNYHIKIIDFLEGKLNII
ncbi:hypothetical protein ACQ1Q5_02185 [Ornithobacterium rhinotracheale]